MVLLSAYAHYSMALRYQYAVVLMPPQQREAIVEVATEEMDQACNEVGLQQQLEELEALVLARGLLGAGDRCHCCTYWPAILAPCVDNVADSHLHASCLSFHDLLFLQ